ncbi:hypothetical protein BH11MYX4_BH11MYX4_54850 [soil metagenome]
MRSARVGSPPTSRVRAERQRERREDAERRRRGATRRAHRAAACRRILVGDAGDAARRIERAHRGGVVVVERSRLVDARPAALARLAIARHHDRRGHRAVGEADVVADLVGDGRLEIDPLLVVGERERARRGVDLDVRVIDVAAGHAEGLVRERQGLLAVIVGPELVAEIDAERHLRRVVPGERPLPRDLRSLLEAQGRALALARHVRPGLEGASHRLLRAVHVELLGARGMEPIDQGQGPPAERGALLRAAVAVERAGRCPRVAGRGTAVRRGFAGDRGPDQRREHHQSRAKLLTVRGSQWPSAASARAGAVPPLTIDGITPPTARGGVLEMESSRQP